MALAVLIYNKDKSSFRKQCQTKYGARKSAKTAYGRAGCCSLCSKKWNPQVKSQGYIRDCFSQRTCSACWTCTCKHYLTCSSCITVLHANRGLCVCYVKLHQRNLSPQHLGQLLRYFYSLLHYVCVGPWGILGAISRVVAADTMSISKDREQLLATLTSWSWR